MSDSNEQTFNGNKIGFKAAPGGGATDFRLEKGSNWYDFESLKSRIMVAGAGGGADCYSGGDGGSFEGMNGQIVSGIGSSPGNQTNGGQSGKFDSRGYAFDGEFGVGGSGSCKENTETCDGAGGGGSGYYGGGGVTGNGGGSGGSSYVSGHEGCIAINDKGEPTETSIHYSQHTFKFSRMISGNEEMPTFKRVNLTMTGNSDLGFARITFLYNSNDSCTSKCSFSFSFVYIISFILSY